MANLENSSSTVIEVERLSSSSNNQQLITALETIDTSPDDDQEKPYLEKVNSSPKVASVDLRLVGSSNWPNDLDMDATKEKPRLKRKSSYCPKIPSVDSKSREQKMSGTGTAQPFSASQENQIGYLSPSIGIPKGEPSASIKKEEKSASGEGEKTSASIRSEDQVRHMLIEIMENVEPDPRSECCFYRVPTRIRRINRKRCIYRVPKQIRRINKKAYTPQLVSIGPLHHGKEKLAEMEKQKGGYVKSFFDRLPPGKDNEIITFLQYNEQLIRDSYAETIKLKSPQFVTMIMCDAIFIIEHLLRIFYSPGRDDSWPNVPAVLIALSLDLQLLENQLPYFILEGIYNLAFEEDTLLQICKDFFKRTFLLEFPDQREVKHFTDAIRTALVKGYPEAVKPKGRIRDLPCALELDESGVKLNSKEGEGLLDVRFEKAKGLASCLKAPELNIPSFSIYDETECIFRNVMALEQCHYPSDTKFCNYVRLMDFLINTEKDVELLVEEKIISNVVGDNAEVVNMVNRLSSHIALDEDSCYYKACEELKAHCENRWNKTKATLRRVYFSNLWTGTATVAAILLLILTAIQTICSIFQIK